VLQNAPMEEVEIEGLSLSPVEIESGISKFDLTLTMEEEEEGLSATLEYNTDLFDHTTMERMAGHLQRLFESAVAEPQEKVSRLEMLSETERQQLLIEWNSTLAQYPADRCIHELFEEQVSRTPDAIALVYEEEEMSYRELNSRANQLAHYLREMGAGPE